MRTKRSWLALGATLALACPAMANEPGTPMPMPMPSISSPYNAREADVNGGGVVQTAGVSLADSQVPPPAAAPAAGYQGGYNYGNGGGYGSGCGTSCGTRHGYGGGFGVYAPPMIGHVAPPYVLKADPVFITNRATGERGANFARQGRPVFSRGSYLVSEGESAQPMSRGYLRADYLEIKGSFPSLSPLIDKVRFERATLGLEKACWDDHMSFGLRVPFYNTKYSARTINDGGFLVELSENLDDDEQLGDISLIFKCASGNYARTGKVCTIGLVATLPTGESISSFDLGRGLNEDKHVGLLQPFLGYLIGWNEIYVQGFSSLVCPVRSGIGDDVTLWHNSLGVGYWLVGGGSCGGGGGHGLLGGGLISAVVPTLELHVTSPLKNGGEFEYFRNEEEGGAIFVSDGSSVRFLNTVVVSGGVHVGVSDHSWVTIGGSVPLSTQPFDYQATVQLNIQF